jgi:cyclopropane fatty-acyl-phospholipid synthase-like methyltransferase
VCRQKAISYTPRQVSKLLQLVCGHIPQNSTRILDVRCFDGVTTLALAQAFPDATVIGIDTHSSLYKKTRAYVEQAPNTVARLTDLRKVRVEHGPPYDAVVFMRPAGSYKKTEMDALTSFMRAVGHAVDILKPHGGRLIIVRSKATGYKHDVAIPSEKYRLLFENYLDLNVLHFSDELIVVECT